MKSVLVVSRYQAHSLDHPGVDDRLEWLPFELGDMTVLTETATPGITAEMWRLTSSVS